MIIVYWFTIKYDDTNYLDMISLSETYNIFDDILDDLRGKVVLSKDKYSNIYDNYKDLKKLIKF